MECHLFQVDTFVTQSLKHALSEVQAGSRSRYGSFDLRIDGLIGFLVAFLRFPVQIGRNGQFAEHFQNIGKGDFRVIPGEIHPVTGAAAFPACGSQGNRMSLHVHFLMK